MKDILFATHNPWKKDLFRPVFSAYGFATMDLNDIPSAVVPVDEHGATAVANALSKARRYHSPSHPWVFADDAGLEIDALDGEPGVQARRWGGRFQDTVDDETWLNYLLERMDGIPRNKRTARFVSGWVLITPDGSEYLRATFWPFEIALRPIRPIQPGSPITAVRVGPPDDLSRRQIEIKQEWERWGIFEQLLLEFGGR